MSRRVLSSCTTSGSFLFNRLMRERYPLTTEEYLNWQRRLDKTAWPGCGPHGYNNTARKFSRIQNLKSPRLKASEGLLLDTTAIASDTPTG
jgi:hypothetical protein